MQTMHVNKVNFNPSDVNEDELMAYILQIGESLSVEVKNFTWVKEIRVFPGSENALYSTLLKYKNNIKKEKL